MTREQAIKVAKEAAANPNFGSHEYTKVEDFQPHEWVIQAIITANNIGYIEGLNGVD